ncbi:hypothetical protein GCM10027448_34030 [Nocardioides dilutus]
MAPVLPGTETIDLVSRHRLNWVIVVAPFVPAFAAGAVLASAAALRDEAKLRAAIAMWAVVTLLSLAVAAFGGWRIYQGYKRSNRLW